MSDDERYWPTEELNQELMRRGCVSTGHPSGRGTIWLNASGQVMTVPAPPDARGYPPRLARDLLYFADLGNRPDFLYH